MGLRVLSHVRLFVTPWTVAHQAPLSVGFPRQEYWSGLLFQGIFLTQDWTQVSCVSCFGRWILYHFITYCSYWSQLANQHWYFIVIYLGFPGASDSKESACHEEDPAWIDPPGSIPGLGRSPEELASHSSILAWRIPMDRGAWRALVYGVEESDWVTHM